MKVRGWLNIGHLAMHELPPEQFAGNFYAVTPTAAAYTPGQWIVWSIIAGGRETMVLVCVDVPL
jgi:hypothetical protein